MNYGNQDSLVMPVFTHYGVESWVPEVGGRRAARQPGCAGRPGRLP